MVNRTFEAIRQKYFWRHMHQDIQDYIKNCDICQRVKSSRRVHPPPLNPLPVSGNFYRVHMDMMCSLPKTKEGYKGLLFKMARGSPFENTGSRRDSGHSLKSIFYKIWGSASNRVRPRKEFHVKTSECSM